MKETRTVVVAIVLCTIVGAIGGAIAVTEATRKPTTSTSAFGTETMVNTMDHAMDGMMSNLNGKTGEELDKAFLEDMIVHHEGAIEMAEMVSSSKHKEIRDLSKAIIKAQTREIEQMKKWHTAWFK